MKAYIYTLLDNGEELEQEVELEGNITPYHRATMYKNNGDPGDPEEGGELEDFTIYLDGKDITNTISVAQYEMLELYFIENWEEPELW